MTIHHSGKGAFAEGDTVLNNSRLGDGNQLKTRTPFDFRGILAVYVWRVRSLLCLLTMTAHMSKPVSHLVSL